MSEGLDMGAAIEAGALALAATYSEQVEDSSYELDAHIVIDTVAPLIEAAVREQVAREIEAVAARLDALSITHQNRYSVNELQSQRATMLDAAAIAREVKP